MNAWTSSGSGQKPVVLWEEDQQQHYVWPPWNLLDDDDSVDFIWLFLFSSSLYPPTTYTSHLPHLQKSAMLNHV